MDVVLSDAPIPPSLPVKAFNHLLGACGVTVFAAPRLAPRYRRGFPASLDGAPFLLPAQRSTLRRSIDHWMDVHNIRPQVAGEFKDSALMKTFGSGGAGLFFGPSAIEEEIRRNYRVGIVGRVEAIKERFYAISVERKLKHPAVVAICAEAPILFR
jgi:LysR family transcriptional activator of nhaA